MSKYQFLDRRVPIEDGNIALVQDLSKCKNCSLCRKACAVDMGVFDYYDLTTNGDHPICSTGTATARRPQNFLSRIDTITTAHTRYASRKNPK